MSKTTTVRSARTTASVLFAFLTTSPKWILCAAVACAALIATAGPARAQAGYEFTAVVSEAGPGTGYIVGTEFTGTLSWDPLTAVTNPDPFSNGNATEYGGGIITVAGLGSLAGTYGGSGNIKVVDDNFNAGSPNDQFLMEIFGSPNPARLSLTDTSGDLWSSQSLQGVSPLLSPVEQFEIATLTIGEQSGGPGATMTAVIVSLGVPVSSYTEDFTTTSLRDGPATSATWDTFAEELRHELGFGMVPIGTLAGASQFRDVAVTGNIAVAAVSGAGTIFVDISDPENPVQVGFYGGFVYKLEVTGSHAILARATSGVDILDISDPANPTSVAIYQPGGLDARDVAVVGNLVYVADYSGGLTTLDISNPASPNFVGGYASAGFFSITMDGPLAYLTSGTKVPGLTILDVADTMSPSLVGTYATPSSYAVVPADGLAYMAVGAAGLEILDVSDPSNPGLLGAYAASGDVYGLARAGTRLLAADYGAGLLTLDASDPTNPILESSSPSPGLAYDVDLVGELAFVSSNGKLEIYKTASSTGQSLPVDRGIRAIPRARLTAVESPGVTWEISSTNGADFTPITAGSDWTPIDVVGDNLVWRSTLSPSLDPAAHPNPSVSGLTLEWLLDAPTVTAVQDIPNDQGRQVRLEWRRSGYDFVGDPTQIVEYAVYRRIEGGLVADKSATAALAGQGLGPAVMQHAQAMAAAGWDFVTTVPVRVQDDYAVVVPTLADSTITAGQALTTFMVSALTATPGVFFDSVPESGYSVDNLAPAAPAGVVATYESSGVSLDWADALEGDFQAFRVYRSTVPTFVPGPGNLVQETGASSWVDPVSDPWSYSYKVTAVDFAGNESDVGSPGQVSDVGDEIARARNALMNATPNPFNPTTRLAFELAAPGTTRLRVYDAAGRLVATLLDEHRAAGRHQVTWDGRDDRGRPAAAGVYLYRIEAGSFQETRRMTLVK